MKDIKSLRFLWGGIAIAIYAGFIALLIFYFNSRHSNKPKHFVKKNEKRIQLASVKPIEAIKVKTIIAKSTKPREKQTQNPKEEVVQKTIKAKKPKEKKIHQPKKIITKKVHKEKIVKKIKKKKKDTNTRKVKTHIPLNNNRPKPKAKKESKHVAKKTSDLFSSVQINKKEKAIKNKIVTSKKPKSAAEKISESIKNQKESQSGVENAYYAKVQSLLETWPAQSDYAGEKAMVHLYVKPTGLFEFKVKSQSDNVEFNLGLIDFLMQLQKLGFGTHKGGKTYEFEVEFIAKE